MILKFLSFNRERNDYNNTKGIENVIDILRQTERKREREGEKEKEKEKETVLYNKLY